MVVAGNPPPPHVAVFAFPFGSHLWQIYTLTRALAAAAPTAIFSLVSTAGSLAGLPRTAENIRFCEIEDGMPEGGAEAAKAGLVERVESFLAAAPGNLRASKEAAEAGAGGIPVSCVVSDAFIWEAASVAEEMEVPWAPVVASFPLALLAHLHTDNLRRRFGVEGQVMPAHADDLLDFIPGLATMRVRDLPEGVVFSGTDSMFAAHLYGMAQRLLHAPVVALAAITGLDPEADSHFHSKLNHPLLVAPLHLLSSPSSPLSDKELCLPWLDRRAPSSVAYVSFGSFSSLPLDELAELAHGLEDSGAPFLWSLKEEERTALPEGFVERTAARGKVVAWTPQVAVLGHPAVGVFVSHGGWCSAQESMAAGVAMIFRPVYGDQRMVARAVAASWGFGVNLEGEMTRVGLVGALNGVLKGKEGKKMRAKARDLKEMIEKAISAGGSSSENLKTLVEFVCRR
ncbi:UDP-glycosyltransferase 78D2 [Apostasia shenzhenica]|uniref:UDP-glycosyltransferase 78D2 n=1 Tax=Apostasia shenzhenica TaxID=1088818 RepID=A0A2I0BCC0_9ASPA|nr:UDP-glycosyltransferase 78D2 [Apostasia shenzhenica]